ncbi:MAG: HU family DNA-binding protein [Prevotella sp.]|nr:HU family DNA-binding protein [Prevotella sp.]
MNKEELIAEISKKAKVTKKAASDVLTATINAIQTLTPCPAKSHAFKFFTIFRILKKVK